MGSCIKNSWIAPLIKNQTNHFFKYSRGLKKGFPFSPLLYVLMAEALNKILKYEGRSISILGLKIERGVRGINHSQFVDHTLFLGGASKTLDKCFKLVLHQYVEVSGCIINEINSQIFAWNIRDSYLMRIANINQYPFSVEQNYFKYLGMPC